MHTILIANRGEIAVRIVRACRDLGLRAVAVFSECDRGALHVRLADEAYALGDSPAADSYLRIDRLIDVARRAGADAVHPGYGFLAENAAFAAACREAGLVFIGPTPEVMAVMGSKTGARHVAARAGVPVVPGSEAPIAEGARDEEILAHAGQVGYPLLVKAVAGGGGKGMRAVAAPADLLAAVRTARSEARSAFGDPAVYFERRIERPRHVEVQVLGDRHGTVVPFVERECSMQRRHQKLIEETPSPVVSADVRAAMTAAAARIAREAGYTGAGTVEFLFDARHEAFYFLEMNTRLQVEHPVTELVAGVDLVAAQVAIARGEPLALDPRRVLVPDGHAIECRVYAEDPGAGFMPSPGRLTHVQPPAGPGVRDDSGVVTGSDIPVFYDPLISKLVTWGADRAAALARMVRALAEYDIRGVRTTIPFFREVLQHPGFRRGEIDTTFVDRLLAARAGAAATPLPAEVETLAALAASLHLLEGDGDGAMRPAPTRAQDAWKARARAEGLQDWPPA